VDLGLEMHETYSTPLDPAIKKTQNKKHLGGFVALIIICLLCGMVGSLGASELLINHKTQIVKVIKPDKSVLEQPSSTQIRGVINDLSNSVVMVDGLVTNGLSQGTGVAINATGLILTCYHIVKDAYSINVSMNDKFQDVPTTLVSYDSADDLALLQAQNLSGLTPVSFASPNSITVGESVLVIGYSFNIGPSPSVTSGIVSALGRNVQASSAESGTTENLYNVLQTDAAINAGDSGGPIVNMQGQVVGIAAAVAQPTQNLTSVQDIGFGIPSSTILSVLPRLEQGQDIGSPSVYLGIQATDLTDQIKLFYGIAAQINSGILVEKVEPNSPADLAGLHSGDVITAVNNIAVSSVAQFNQILAQFHPGDTIALTVYPYILSNTVAKTYMVTLGQPSESQLPIGQ